jgi:hypothetical protein
VAPCSGGENSSEVVGGEFFCTRGRA